MPIILNIKNFDLFHIDRWSSRFEPEDHLADWQALGMDVPQPFERVTFFAAQQHGSAAPIATGRSGTDVKPYSWSLSDIIAAGLLEYLFAEVDANDSNFSALVLDIAASLTHEHTETDGSVTLSLRSGDNIPATFKDLLRWVQQQPLPNHHAATWQKLYRRLLKLIYESKGVLRKDDQKGHPLKLVRADTSDPIVVDLAALAGEPELQRFVLATVLRQLVTARTGSNAVKGLVYLVMVDELNRFAPRGARDPITRLVETVAAEMRSQGIILLGAQQQASKVSERVVENAAIRVLGRTGSLELASSTWRFLSDSARRKAENLTIAEKLVVQDNFREPMHVRVPFPAWAMNPREASLRPPDGMGTADAVEGDGNASDDFSDIIDS
ncbi:MAG TPA: hypothetical protein VGW38_11950 [Chloroflexota bacterium]|nr:hypothetical protein [Chloroflexota bacterium]